MMSQRGFTLIAAIFLLVVVSGLVAYFIQVRVVQSVTLLYGVRSALALEAARGGVEWAAFVSLRDEACPSAADATFVPVDNELAEFTVTVSCEATSHVEAGSTVHVFQIESVAVAGVYGSLDYVQRGLSASVSKPPP